MNSTIFLQSSYISLDDIPLSIDHEGTFQLSFVVNSRTAARGQRVSSDSSGYTPATKLARDDCFWHTPFSHSFAQAGA